MSKDIKPGAVIYVLKVSLQDIEPEIWRRLLIPGNCRLDMLHESIQRAMGWTDTHLHGFMINGTAYGDPDSEGFNPKEEVSERGTKSKLKFLNLNVGDTFVYTYDFGDDWCHDITVEKITEPDPKEIYIKCVGGERACPREDCGGPYRYTEIVEIMKNPQHPEYEDLAEWLGEYFKPEHFDEKEIGSMPIMVTIS